MEQVLENRNHESSHTCHSLIYDNLQNLLLFFFYCLRLEQLSGLHVYLESYSSDVILDSFFHFGVSVERKYTLQTWHL